MAVTLQHPNGDELVMVQRQDWRARARAGSPTWNPSVPRRSLVLHHTAGSYPTSKTHALQIVRETQAFHQFSRGWSDIAYNFLVDRYGTLIEGRGFFYRNGANTPENSSSYSICYLGNTDRVPFTDEAITTVRWLLSYLNAPVEACPGGCGLKPHKAISATSCPGTAASSWVAAGGLPPEDPCAPGAFTRKAA